MNKNALNLIKTIAFLAILACCIFFLQKLLLPYNAQDTNQNATFYEIDDDSIDVLVCGTSSVMVGISPLQIYEDTGINSYVRGSSVQAPEVTYLTAVDTFKTQSPKVLATSAITLFMDYDYEKYEPWLRRGIDYKKLSMTKLEVAANIQEKSDGAQSIAGYAFPIIRYHSRWEDVLRNGIDDRIGLYDYMHGQYPVYKTTAVEDISEENMKDTSRVEVNEDAMYWFRKIAELCEENDCELLFVTTPDMRWTTGKHEAVERACEELGADFLDYNVDGLTQSCGIEWDSDFYDDHHMNARGSIKATKYFGKYIQKKYNLDASDISDENKAQIEKDMKQFKKDRTEKGYN